MQGWCVVMGLVGRGGLEGEGGGAGQHTRSVWCDVAWHELSVPDGASSIMAIIIRIIITI